MNEFPDDFGSYINTVFGSELSEPLIFAYDLLKFILDYRNIKNDLLRLVVNNDEVHCISSSGEAVDFPFPFRDRMKMCIIEIFARDNLVQELFKYEVIGGVLEVRVRDIAENKYSPIGIFDSGVGGLSVLRAIRAQMPNENITYFGDQGHIPYGPRAMEQIRGFSEAITNFLLERDAKIIVVACNTASAAALKYLREKFPDVKFVGMEPAVKPAAEWTQTGRVAVLATPATFQGALYASVVERFANGVELYQSTCNGLVQQIEQGNLNSDETRKILEEALHPMLEKNIDTVVLGCTHYPFVIQLIQEIVGENVRVIDPAPSVARQVQRLLEAGGLLNEPKSMGKIKLFTSGDPDVLKSQLPLLLGEEGEVERVRWVGDLKIRMGDSHF